LTITECGLTGADAQLNGHADREWTGGVSGGCRHALIMGSRLGPRPVARSVDAPWATPRT
jgi:hypothetical protein